MRVAAKSDSPAPSGAFRYKTAWLMKHNLRQVMSLREGSRQFDGRVEIDDACLGSELPGGKSGRGSENKVFFVPAVQTAEAGHPLYACLTKLEFAKEVMAEWAKHSLYASTQSCLMACGVSRPLRHRGRLTSVPLLAVMRPV